MDTATTSDALRGRLAPGAGLGLFGDAEADAEEGGGAAGELGDSAAAAGAPAGWSCYSDYGETDLEDEAEQAQQRGSGGGWVGAAASGELRLGGESVLALPYADSAGAAAATAEAAPELAPAGGGAAQRAWKQSRRGVEWRLRWLELRMRELRHQRQRYVDRQRAAQQAQQAAAEPAAAATAGPQQGQQSAAEGERRHAPFARRQPLSNLQLPGLLEHPFFGEHSALGKRPREQAAAAAQQPELQQQQLEGSAAAATAEGPSVAAAAAAAGQPSEAVAMQLDDPDYAARAHAALDLLDSRLAALRAEILSMQRPGSALLAGAGGGLGVPAASGGRLLPLLLTGGGGGSGRPRGRPPGSTPRARSLHKKDSLRDSKRRRAEFDLNDIALPTLGAPKYVERVQVRGPHP